jgi:hypothetical protein
MKKLVNKSISIALSILLIVAVLPVSVIKVTAALPTPTGNVANRIQQLRQLFDTNSYFSENGNACTHSSSSHCNASNNDFNCRFTEIMRRRFNYSQTQVNLHSWADTCAGFARFAYFYIFGNPWNVSGSNAPSTAEILPTTLIADARPGDIVRWSTNTHWALYLGNNLFFHSNINGTNRVSYGTAFDGTIIQIIRANNYDEINSYTVTLNRNSGTGGTASVRAVLNQPMPSATMPTRTGFAFQGYFDTSAATGGTRYYNANGTSARNWDKTSNSILWARWTPTNTSFNTALPLTLTNNIADVNITTTNQMLFYSFTPPTTGFYTFESLNNGFSDPFGWLFNSNATPVELVSNDNGAGSSNFRIVYHLSASQRYFIRAGCFQNGTGNYRLRVTRTSSLSSTPITPNPSAITTTTTRTVSIGKAYERQYFTFTAPSAGTYRFESFNNGASDPYGWVYNVNGTQLAANSNSGGNNNFSMLVYNMNRGDTVYFVAGCTGANTGVFQVRVTQ